MSLYDDFKSFCAKILLDNYDDIQTTVGEIAKKLNSHYYDLQGESSEHIYIVGSIGRGTAIKNSSDVDVIFDFPKSVYDRFDAYESNGQSALLQEIKNILLERYPRTSMRGDGQVVVIEFSNYTLELVPGFKQSDDRFKYPDTHDGGSWKTTDPISEQNECQSAEKDSNNNYFNFCHMIRKWKNENNFVFGGLLIDTLVYNHFTKNAFYSTSSYQDYYDILVDLFLYLKDLDKEQSYWFAVGSNQRVYNTDSAFMSKAQDAYNMLVDAEDDDELIYDALSSLFDSLFPTKKQVLRKALFQRQMIIQNSLLKIFFL